MTENTVALERVTDDSIPADRYIYRLPEGTEGAIDWLGYDKATADRWSDDLAVAISRPRFNARRTAVLLPADPGGPVQAVMMEPKGLLARLTDKVFGGAKLTANLTLKDVREALQMALEEAGQDHWPWVIDIVPTDGSILNGDVIYERDDMTLVRRGYAMESGGAITLSGDMTPVRRETTWHDVVVTTNQQETETMTTMQERVAAIVAHDRSQFTDADTEYLSGLSEDRIASIEANLAANAAPPKVPQTPEEYLAAAPKGIREVFEAGQAELKAKRDGLIEQVLKAGDTFTREELEAMETPLLAKTAKLATPADFRGQGAPRSVGQPEPKNPGYTPVTFGGRDPLEPKAA